MPPPCSRHCEKCHYRRIQGMLRGTDIPGLPLRPLIGSSRGSYCRSREIRDSQHSYKYHCKRPPGRKLGSLTFKVCNSFWFEPRANEVHRVGEDVLLHLFTGTSVFTPLPNGCLCQVTGEHIHNLAQLPPTPSPSLPAAAKRKASGVGEGESRPSKQRKLNSPGTSKKKYILRSHWIFSP